MQTKWYYYIKDIVLYPVLIVLMVISSLNFISKPITFDLVAVLFTQCMIYAIAASSFFELMYTLDISILVPHSYIIYKYKKNYKSIELSVKEYFKNDDATFKSREQERLDYILTNNEKAVKQYIREYFKNEIEFIKRYDKEKTNYIMSLLELSSEDIADIRLDMINIRMMPIKTDGNVSDKLKAIISLGNIIIDTSTISPAEKTYESVKYFVNFIDSMFEEDFNRHIVSLMSRFITLKLGAQKLANVKRIILPYGSNYLLGVGLSKSLHKPLVKVLQGNGRVIHSQCWDGKLLAQDKIIVIHDVLVTGDQVVKSIEKLPKTCQKNIEFFCLISRKEWDGRKKLEEIGVTVYSILELDDEDIRTLKGVS